MSTAAAHGLDYITTVTSSGANTAVKRQKVLIRRDLGRKDFMAVHFRVQPASDEAVTIVLV